VTHLSSELEASAIYHRIPSCLCSGNDGGMLKAWSKISREKRAVWIGVAGAIVTGTVLKVSTNDDGDIGDSDRRIDTLTHISIAKVVYFKYSRQYVLL
jgi:hypothetical protein